MTNVISINPVELPEDHPFSRDAKSIKTIAENAPALKARRDAVTMLERLTGAGEDQSGTQDKNRTMLMSGSVILCAATLMATLPNIGVGTALASIGTGLALALSSERMMCSARQVFRKAGLDRREGLQSFTYAAPQVVGLMLASTYLGVHSFGVLGLLGAVVLASLSGWRNGEYGLRAMQLRLEVQHARSELEAAETEFEDKLDDVRRQFDQEVERLRAVSGAKHSAARPEQIAAE